MDVGRSFIGTGVFRMEDTLENCQISLIANPENLYDTSTSPHHIKQIYDCSAITGSTKNNLNETLCGLTG
jgi:hypothetical protein